MIQPYAPTGTKSSDDDDDDDDEYVKELKSDTLAWANSHIYLIELITNKSEMHIKFIMTNHEPHTRH